MTSAFERHGLDHLSASSINLFVAQPAMWAMQKLLGHKSRVGAAAHRGTAIEAGVELGLFDPGLPLEACQEAALARFAQLTALSADPNVEKERAGIASAVAIALGELRQYGIPGSADGTRQHRIEVELPGVPVPFIGWLDFWFPEHGIIIDLKTQGRLSSKISDPHARQGAIYHAAHGNNEIRFAYVTPQKIGVYRLEDQMRLRWAGADPNYSSHPYLTAKGIRPGGTRLDREHILVPLFDAAGALTSLQSIDPAGHKLFEAELPVAGSAFVMGTPRRAMTTWSILGHTAKVLEERRGDYGDPAEQFKAIAERWSITLGTPITAAQIALCMIDLKLTRLSHDPGHFDSLVDVLGYAALLREVR